MVLCPLAEVTQHGNGDVGAAHHAALECKGDTHGAPPQQSAVVGTLGDIMLGQSLPGNEIGGEYGSGVIASRVSGLRGRCSDRTCRNRWCGRVADEASRAGSHFRHAVDDRCLKVGDTLDERSERPKSSAQRTLGRGTHAGEPDATAKHSRSRVRHTEPPDFHEYAPGARLIQRAGRHSGKPAAITGNAVRCVLSNYGERVSRRDKEISSEYQIPITVTIAGGPAVRRVRRRDRASH